MITDETAKVPMADSSIEQILSRLVNTARVDAVFGQPVERGDTTVIPCSEVTIGLGMGSGGGPVDAQGYRTGGGSGAGGSATGRPIAVIVITKIALAGLTTGAFILVWIGRLIRTRRSDKGPSFSQLRKAIQK